MALVTVRSKQPINGEHIESVVDEAWLERWPDDWELVTETETPVEPAVEEPVDDELDQAPADAAAPAVGDEPKPSGKGAVGFDPTVSAD